MMQNYCSQMNSVHLETLKKFTKACLLDFENVRSLKEYRFSYPERNNPSYFISMTH